MILIHTALLCEAQSFIEKYKLKKINSSPKVYANDIFIICISGIGKENTLKSLDYIFNNYTITKAFNIGIAGCNNSKIPIGNLYSTNKKLQDIETLPLVTLDEIVTNSDLEETTLYDMEAEYFYHITQKYLDTKEIFIFKIVSDHLSSKILEKDIIKNMISKQRELFKFIKLI